MFQVGRPGMGQWMPATWFWDCEDCDFVGHVNLRAGPAKPPDQHHEPVPPSSFVVLPKGRDACEPSTENEGVHLIGALIGAHRFEVVRMAHG